MNEPPTEQMRKLSRRGFLWAGVVVFGGYGGLRWLNTRREEDGVIWPLRKWLQFNEQVSRDFYSGRALAPTFDKAKAVEPTVNYLDEEAEADPIDVDEYRLVVEGLYGKDEPLRLTLDQIKKLPRVEQTTELNCIEGWTAVVHWSGVRFVDLADHLGPATRSGEKPDVRRRPDDILEYVGMETPDGLYYVGLDTLSALHPQTLLAYEMNGEELTHEHGYPLRLVIPTKYGIKNIKRIGTIRFVSERPRDYWAEQGYDWYAGL